MKFSYNWLSDYVNLSQTTPEDLAQKLTMAGFEVEGIHPIGEKLDQIITGKIEDIQPHPDADKLVVTQLNDGKTQHQIVTGAKNISVGDIVPVSLPGATLANGMKIKSSKLRGVPSDGMLCSEAELGVSEEAAGIWILPPETKIGLDFIDYAKLKDTVLDVSILANRGDCQSMLGLAREIGVLLGEPVQPPKITEETPEKKSPVTVKIETEFCKYYTAQMAETIVIQPSPLWMQQRLRVCGIRPINNVVDITNYVLLEFGQPLHAFDAKKLKSGKIKVRLSKKNESITTLDGDQQTLPAESGLICDDNTPIAVAGVMGGADSEVSDSTTSLVIESAYFDPIGVRKTASALHLRTESAIRFEKGVDLARVKPASQRALTLLAELAGATHSTAMVEAGHTNQDGVVIDFEPEKINRLLGTNIGIHVMIETLKNLGFEFDRNESHVTAPTWRHDVSELPDLAEEIARIQGLDSIPTELPTTMVVAEKASRIQTLTQSCRQHLIHLGFNECCTYPMIGPDDLARVDHRSDVHTLQNPLSPDESVMRPTMLPSLLKAIRTNRDRQQPHLALFEISKVFEKQAKKNLETTHLVIGLTGNRFKNAYSSEQKALNQPSFTTLKGYATTVLKSLDISDFEVDSSTPSWLHPGQSATLKRNGVVLGEIGFVHPQTLKSYQIDADVGFINLNLSAISELDAPTPRFKPYSKFPHIRRDIAMLVPEELTFADIMGAFGKSRPKSVKDIFLFDHYQSDQLGAGKKSIAMGLIYENAEKTLTDEEVNRAHEKLCKRLTQLLPIEIR